MYYEFLRYTRRKCAAVMVPLMGEWRASRGLHCLLWAHIIIFFNISCHGCLSLVSQTGQLSRNTLSFRGETALNQGLITPMYPRLALNPLASCIGSQVLEL